MVGLLFIPDSPLGLNVKEASPLFFFVCSVSKLIRQKCEGEIQLDMEKAKAFITEAMTDNEELITAWQNAWLTTLRLLGNAGIKFVNIPNWLVFKQSLQIMLHALLRFQDLHVD